MRISDTFRLSCHTIRQDRVRTALTIATVCIVAALAMFLLLIGISIRENLLAVAQHSFEETGADYTMSGARAFNLHNNEIVGAISDEEYALFSEHAAQHAEVCGDDIAYSNLLSLSESLSDRFILFTGNFRGFETTTNADGFWIVPSQITAKSFTSVPKGIAFREGRCWMPADSDKDVIFLSRDFKDQCENYGHTVGVGDEVLLLCMGSKQTLCAFTVAGIYEGGGSYFYIGTDKLFALSHLTDALYVQQIRMRFEPPAGVDYDYDATFASMRAFTDEMTAALDQDYDLENFPGADLFAMLFSDVTRRFVNDFVDKMRLVEIISGIVIAVCALFAFLVLLLSVGSVASSVVISVDKNKKFFGMMKAVGLNVSGLRGLVFCELLVIVAAGVLLGIAFLYALLPVANTIVVSLFNYLFGALLPFAVSAAVPVWLPLTAAAFFLLLTMLFARGSIKKIAAQDVMATLSEAA